MRRIGRYARMMINNPQEFWDVLRAKYSNVDPFYRKLLRERAVTYDKTNNTYIRDVKGNKLHLDPQDVGISRVLARDGIRERESVDALYKYVSPDMTILDLGANIGFYVVLEAQIVSRGRGRIIAVEPAPENVRLLKLSIDANNYHDCVTVFRCAICDSTGTVKLRLSDLSNSHKLATLGSSASGVTTIDVPAFTFADFMKHAGVDMKQLDFLRMDVESAEYMILPTIYDFFERRESLLMFIEFHPWDSPRKHREVLKKLASTGFRCLTVTKEYVENGHIARSHRPDTSIEELYEEDFFLQFGGCEVFLKKG